MKCGVCGAVCEEGYTTSVTELDDCLVIVRNVPCHKCMECTEIIYTTEVVKNLEKILEDVSRMTQEISIVDYAKVAHAGDSENLT